MHIMKREEQEENCTYQLADNFPYPYIYGRTNIPNHMIDRIMGNASQVDPSSVMEILEPVLVKGEHVELAFKLVRDFFVFTSKRIIFVDVQGLSGKKKEFHSVPYKSITQFSVETGGTFDRDVDLKIWVSSQKDPIVKDIKKGGGIAFTIQRELAQRVMF